MKQQLRLLFNESEVSEDVQRYKDSMQMIDSIEKLRKPNMQVTFFADAPKKQPVQDNVIRSRSIYRLRQTEFYYFKIELMKHKSPLNCTVHCDCDFQMMVSFTNPLPNRFNCERMIRSRSWSIRYQEEDLLYVSLISKKDTEVRFSIYFGVQEHKRIVKYQPEHHYSDVQLPKPPSHLIELNKSLVCKTQNRYEQQLNLSQKNFRVLKTMSQQRELLKSEQSIREYNYHAKFISHQSQLLHRAQNYKHTVKMSFDQNWVQILHLIKVCQHIHIVFEARLKIIKKIRMALFQMKFKLSIMRKRFVKQRGVVLEDRTIVDTHCAVKMFARQIYSKLRNKYIQATIPVLYKRKELYSIKVKMLSTYKKVFLIRQTFVEFGLKVRVYKAQMLLKWDNFISKQYSISIKQKNSERDKRMHQWLKQLQNRDFNDLMKKNYLNLLMKERFKNHSRDQKKIILLTNEKHSTYKLMSQERNTIEQAILRSRYLKALNELQAMQIGNQFFIHSDVEPFQLHLMDHFLEMADEPETQEQKKKTQRVSFKRRFDRQSLLK